MPPDNVIPLKGMSWVGLLSRGDKGTHATVANAIIIICHDPVLRGMVAYDEFAHRQVMMRPPPIAFDGARFAPGPYPRQIEDGDVTLIQSYIQRAQQIRLSQAVAFQAVCSAAEVNRIHPVRDWLDGLEWDGQSRLSGWLSNAFGAPLDEYHMAVGVKWLCASVRRVRRPGCKFDCMPILEGGQGIGKSRACRMLFGEEWFADDLSHDLADKDAQQGLTGKWGVEFAEVQALVRSTANVVKAFLSRQVDHYRPPYGRTFVERPRQCTFVGTTNEFDYLTDTTGNRRFWPIRCGGVDAEWIAANREQLWAEAAEVERSGINLWLDDEAVRKCAEGAQDERRAEDVWTQFIVDWLAGRTRIRIADLLHDGLGLTRDKQTRAAEMRVAGVLRGQGWSVHVLREYGKNTRFWVAPGSDLPGETRDA